MWFAESWPQYDKAEFRAKREQPKNGYSGWNSRGGGSGVGKMGEGLNQNFFFFISFFYR